MIIHPLPEEIEELLENPIRSIRSFFFDRHHWLKYHFLCLNVLDSAASTQWHCSKSRLSPTRARLIYWALSLSRSLLDTEIKLINYLI